MRKIVLISIAISIFVTSFAQSVNGVIEFEDEQFKVVKVWGTHEERGYAVGYLLADGIDDLFENYLLPAFGTYYSTARNLMGTDAHIKIDSIYIYEAMAMADGINASGLMEMEVDHVDVLLANSFLDFQNFLGKGLGLDNGCSSLISWGSATDETDLNGKSVMSRHLDWDDQPVIVRNQVMIIHIPSEVDEQPWALVGFAGQMSVLSGFNQSGVGVMQHMLSDVNEPAIINKSYEPVWFTMRKAIEMTDYNGDGFNNCLDINDAVNANINGYADSYIVTGIAPAIFESNHEIATIIEVAPEIPYITIRNTDYVDGIPGDNLYAANWTIARNDLLHYCQRYNAVMANFGDGTNIGSQQNWEIMLDYSSSCIPGGFGNIQFMQFVPENNYFKLAYHHIGGPQACSNTPIVYNTDELFQLPLNKSDVNSKSKIRVYPNPAKDKLNVVVPNEEVGKKLMIVSVNGTVEQVKIIENQQMTIDISNFKKGVYFIKIQNTDFKTKIVVEQ
ncbi:MAG: T9SS type A sorting domain-containing protein [Bacteroidales bacterium]|nr:T9SS type A sorting domain-containing protein [Bacteroidales bacterium]